MTARHSAARLLLLFNLLLAGVLILAGMLAVARRPTLLDVVLNLEQLQDQKLVDYTLMLLKRGAGSDWAVMLLAGLIILGTSVPLWAIIKRNSDR